MMNFKTLRGKLLGLLGVVMLVSLALFTIMANFEIQAIRRGKETLARTLVESYIDKIDRNLFERYGDVQAFALSESARSGSPERITAFMNDMMGAYTPIYDVLMVANKSGKIIAVNGVDKNGKDVNLSTLIGRDFSSAPWFKESISGKIEPGTAFVEDVQLDSEISKVFGKNLYYMNFSSPIRDKTTGALLGVWTNRMSWADVVENITAEELKKVRTPEQKDIFAFLMNGEGLYIVHPEGDAKEHKSSFLKFDERISDIKKATQVGLESVSSNYFNGNAYQAVTSEKGYSTYPSKGWTAAIQISSEENALTYTWALIFLACVTFCAILGFSWLVIRRVTSSLARVASDLTMESSSVKAAASQISVGSKSLAQASTVQASALQETASAVEETNAMVKKSADNAMRSRQVSGVSHDAASRGKEAVQEMMRAIGEINTSNESIMVQIEDSNRQISDIVKVINEIGGKTKVINDIVFQTKLLSFNASVEAARAGEHGKGFAVVAEEVGNLAQMSGNAAKEIADMLNGSIQRVDGIVSNTKSQVERLIADGKSKVQSGTIIAKQCGEILDDVVRNVSEVNDMIGEISTAAQEQSQGVSEITKAINQLDQSTHDNANISQDSAKAADQLSGQAEKLMGVVHDLEMIIQGEVQKVTIPKANLPKIKSPEIRWQSFNKEKSQAKNSSSKVPGSPMSMVSGDKNSSSRKVR